MVAVVIINLMSFVLGSGSRDVKDVLKEAEDLLDETDQDSDDFSSSDDESSAESFGKNVVANLSNFINIKYLSIKLLAD